MENTLIINRMAADLIRYYLPSEWQFKFDNAKNRYGFCSHRDKVISLSSNLVELNSIEESLDTVLHEIAHGLLPATVGHSDVWRALAVSIGCNGARTHNAKTVSKQYIGKCPNLDCNRTIYRHRRKRLACGRCCKENGGGFDPAYLFIWTKRKTKQTEEL